MAISQKIISGNQQPHDGYGYVGLAGNKGLNAAGKILGSGVFASNSTSTPTFKISEMIQNYLQTDFSHMLITMYLCILKVHF